MFAVGNVGEQLAAYEDSDMFLTRDGGFTWEEVHKDAHMWEFGDSGSVLVLVNDEGPTDHVIYSIDEGLTWNEYAFDDTLRVNSIQTVPTDTSRKFVLVGSRPNEPNKGVIVYLDFSTISNRKCAYLVLAFLAYQILNASITSLTLLRAYRLCRCIELARPSAR